MISALGFVLGRFLAQQEGVTDDATANRTGLIMSVLGTSPVAAAVTLTIAKNEAQSQTSTPPATGGTSTTGQPAPMVVVPDLTKFSQQNAATVLTALGLADQTVQVVDQAIPIGQVISSTPPAGSQVQAGSSVTLNVSQGFQVPNVVGKTFADATAVLAALGLIPDPGKAKPADTDLVSIQNPAAGTSVSIGDSITLTFSTPVTPAGPPTGTPTGAANPTKVGSAAGTGKS
jgi:hypothetical protein